MYFRDLACPLVFLDVLIEKRHHLFAEKQIYFS